MTEPNVLPKRSHFGYAEPGLPEESQLVDYFTEFLGLKQARIEAHYIAQRRCNFRRNKRHYNQKVKNENR